MSHPITPWVHLSLMGPLPPYGSTLAPFHPMNQLNILRSCTLRSMRWKYSCVKALLMQRLMPSLTSMPRSAGLRSFISRLKFSSQRTSSYLRFSSEWIPAAPLSSTTAHSRIAAVFSSNHRAYSFTRRSQCREISWIFYSISRISAPILILAWLHFPASFSMNSVDNSRLYMNSWSLTPSEDSPVPWSPSARQTLHLSCLHSKQQWVSFSFWWRDFWHWGGQLQGVRGSLRCLAFRSVRCRSPKHGQQQTSLSSGQQNLAEVCLQFSQMTSSGFHSLNSSQLYSTSYSHWYCWGSRTRYSCVKMESYGCRGERQTESYRGCWASRSSEVREGYRRVGRICSRAIFISRRRYFLGLPAVSAGCGSFPARRMRSRLRLLLMLVTEGASRSVRSTAASILRKLSQAGAKRGVRLRRESSLMLGWASRSCRRKETQIHSGVRGWMKTYSM